MSFRGTDRDSKRATRSLFQETGIDSSVHGALVDDPIPRPLSGRGAVLSIKRGTSFSEVVALSPVEGEASVDSTDDASVSIDPNIPPSIPSAISNPKRAQSLLQIIPKAKEIPYDLHMSEFTSMRHLADGTNANVFLVQWRDNTCVLKMIREEKQHDPVALYEFEMELGLLERIDHPNVVNILGKFEILSCNSL